MLFTLENNFDKFLKQIIGLDILKRKMEYVKMAVRAIFPLLDFQVDLGFVKRLQN